jgi:hypothetical protein
MGQEFLKCNRVLHISLVVLVMYLYSAHRFPCALVAVCGQVTDKSGGDHGLEVDGWWYVVMLVVVQYAVWLTGLHATSH